MIMIIIMTMTMMMMFEKEEEEEEEGRRKSRRRSMLEEHTKYAYDIHIYLPSYLTTYCLYRARLTGYVYHYLCF